MSQVASFSLYLSQDGTQFEVRNVATRDGKLLELVLKAESCTTRLDTLNLLQEKLKGYEKKIEFYYYDNEGAQRSTAEGLINIIFGKIIQEETSLTQTQKRSCCVIL